MSLFTSDMVRFQRSCTAYNGGNLTITTLRSTVIISSDESGTPVSIGLPGFTVRQRTVKNDKDEMGRTHDPPLWKRMPNQRVAQQTAITV